MHIGEWSGKRVAAVLASLGDAGFPQARLARIADVNRSTINRWSRGTNRPDHDSVRRLAAAVYRQHPDLARELVEASGYPWTVPEEIPEPELIPPEVLEALDKAVARGDRSPEWRAEVITALEAIARERRGEGESPSGRRAG